MNKESPNHGPIPGSPESSIACLRIGDTSAITRQRARVALTCFTSGFQVSVRGRDFQFIDKTPIPESYRYEAQQNMGRLAEAALTNRDPSKRKFGLRLPTKFENDVAVVMPVKAAGDDNRPTVRMFGFRLNALPKSLGSLREMLDVFDAEAQRRKILLDCSDEQERRGKEDQLRAGALFENVIELEVNAQEMMPIREWQMSSGISLPSRVLCDGVLWCERD